MQYFDAPEANPGQDGVCSDNDCPCGYPGADIPRGTGYLYISKELVDFRRDARTVEQAHMKMERMRARLPGAMFIFDPSVSMPILMCEQGARKRGLDLEVAAADARYWWQHHKAPLRPTPLAKNKAAAPAVQKVSTAADVAKQDLSSPVPPQPVWSPQIPPQAPWSPPIIPKPARPNSKWVWFTRQKNGKSSLWIIIGVVVFLVIAIFAVVSFGKLIDRDSTHTASNLPSNNEPEETIGGGDADRQETSMSNISGEVEIWAAWKQNELQSLNEVIDAFQLYYPEVTVITRYVPFDDLRNQYEAQVATGGGPSILMGSADWGPGLYDMGLVENLHADFDNDLLSTINSAALTTVEYGSALIGLPQQLKGIVLIRNKQIIPSPAKDFADLKSKAQSAATSTIEGAYLEQGFFFSMGTLYRLGASLMDGGGRPGFNNSFGVEWLNVIKGYSEAGPVTNYTDDDLNLFMTGKVGWIIDGTWNIETLKQSIGSQNLGVDVWPYPLSGVVQTENLYLNSNISGNNRIASVEFIKFFVSSEAQQIMAEPGKAAHIPVIQGLDLEDRIAEEIVAAFAVGAPYPVISAMGAYWGPGNNAIKQVAEQNVNPNTALQQMYDAILAALP